MDVAVVEAVVLTPEQIEAERQAREEAERAAAQAKEKLLTDLAADFIREFDDARTHRTDVERIWIDNLRSFKGKYDVKTEQALDESKRSKLFIRLVRSKIKNVVARLADILFPAGDKNWSISPTPVPELDKEAYKAEIALIQQTQGEVSEEAMLEAVQEVARERCENMSQHMDDQLKELDYEAESRKVIFSAALYGTGIMKGPLGSPKMARRWKMVNGSWRQSYQRDSRPYCRAIPIWNYYPDHTATEVKDCRYEFERMPMTKGEVADLKNDDRFMVDRIEDYLTRNPSGTGGALEPWENDVRAVSKNNDAKQPNPDRYIVLVRWGRISGEKMVAAGIAVDDPHQDYETQTWLLGNVIIRIDINPYESGSRPFKLFYYDKDESSMWGEGLASIMSDTMRGANTSLRAATDNAAASAIPNFEVNTDLVAPDESSGYEFTNGRVWQRTGQGADSQYPAVRVLEIPTKVNEFLNLLKLFMELGDEVTNVPRYTNGSANGNDMAKTVGGMSMLMGQANVGIKELAKQWDDGITKPFITDLYAWNMQFSERKSIKGDFEVVARGASSLVAKEIRSNALGSFSDRLLKLAPELAKKRDIFAEIARSLDMNPEAYLKTQDDADKENVEKQTAMAAMEAVAKVAQTLGMPPEAFVANIDQLTVKLKAMIDQVQAQAQVNANGQPV